jgi:hypothetical protein
MDHRSISDLLSDEFVVFDHPVLPQRIVNAKAFSWPALLIGPAWLLWKRLWSWAAITLVITAFLYFLSSSGALHLEVNCHTLLGERMCDAEENPWPSLLISAGLNLACALFGNRLWAEDLIRRGYVIGSILKANSTDHVRAILARKSKWQDTRPNGA